MLKKIVRGYGAIALTVIRFLALLAIAVGAGALIAWPLWSLADSNPALYTLIFTVLFLGIVGFFAAGRIAQAFRRDARAAFLSLLRKLVVLAGIGSPVLLVLAHRRVFALIALLIAFAAYGFLAFGLSPSGTKSADSQ
ncbi:MAG TPA: hypothetical protein PK542_09050 [Treponemataceae bacterium]|nr:hypothetical protein [Treponemataceae bacterium]